MRARGITAAASGLLAVALVAGGIVATQRESHADAVTAVPAPTAEGPAGDGSGQRTVTLITGEQVRLTRVDGQRTVATLDPPAGDDGPDGETRRARTMNVGDHTYVVPDTAMPFIGRQLDLGLFDVTRPTSAVEVDWAPGTTPRAVPGLTTVDGDGGAGSTTTARVSSPAALGSALANGPAGGDLAGIRAIRPATDTAAAAGPAAVDAPPTAVPMYPMATLIVRGIDALGVPATNGGVSVSNAEDTMRFGTMRSFLDGEVRFSVPIGTYSLSVEMTTRDSANAYVADSLVVMPQVEVTGPETVITADARTATVPVPVPRTPLPAESTYIQLTYGRKAAAGGLATTSYAMMGGTPRVLVRPTKPVTVGQAHFYTYFHLRSTADAAKPYVYDLHLPADGVVPRKFATAVKASSLARIDTAFHAEGPEQIVTVNRSSFAPWEVSPFRGTSSVRTPLRRAEYVSALPDVGWMGLLNWRPKESVGYSLGPVTVYRPGSRQPDRYLAAPLVPGPAGRSVSSEPCVACRSGEVLSLRLHPWRDADGHTVDLRPSPTLEVVQDARLYMNETMHGVPRVPIGSITIPEVAADFRLELNTTKLAEWTTTASWVDTVWRWRSQARTGTLPEGVRCSDNTRNCVAEPLLLTEYHAPVALDNTVPAEVETLIGVRVYRQDGGPIPAAGDVVFETSVDDGRTWQAAPLRGTRGRFAAAVAPPADAEYVSFRLRAADPQGNGVDQTVFRAVRVTPPASGGSS